MDVTLKLVSESGDWLVYSIMHDSVKVGTLSVPKTREVALQGMKNIGVKFKDLAAELRWMKGETTLENDLIYMNRPIYPFP
jgi:hypothetical protein